MTNNNYNTVCYYTAWSILQLFTIIRDISSCSPRKTYSNWSQRVRLGCSWCHGPENSLLRLWKTVFLNWRGALKALILRPSKLASIFLNRRVIPFDIPDKVVLTDNKSRIVGIVSATRCVFLAIVRLTRATYQSEAKYQSDTYDETLLTEFRGYVGRRQLKRDYLVHALTYAYII